MPIIERRPPISEQIHRLLRERILKQEYAPGQRLPSEEQLAVEMGVSRATIRTALAALATEGLVIRRQGDGTYVNQSIIEIRTFYEGVWEFTRLIESSGRKAVIRVNQVETRPASPPELQTLQLAPGAEVLVLERLFLADDRPTILSTNIIPTALVCASLSPEAYLNPIHQFLEQYCSQQYAYTIADISATASNEAQSALLGLKLHTPLLRFDEVFFTATHQPIVCAVNFYDDSRLRLRVIRA